MLRVSTCGNRDDQFSLLAAMTREYLQDQGLDAELRQFSHPDALLTAREAERFHLYILDIAMPMVSGLELDREIRRLDREAQIIYGTTEPQFALQAYAASPINDLMKPIDKRQLFDTLSLAVSKADLAGQRTFPVKTADRLWVIRLWGIVCCEYRRHTVLFNWTNGAMVSSRTIRRRFPEYCAASILRLLQKAELVGMRSET